MRNRKFIILIFLLITNCKLFSQKVDFNYARSFTKHENVMDKYIISIRENPESIIGIYPSLDTLNVGPLFEDSSGELYLGFLKEYIQRYANNPDSLLIISVFLKERYNLKNSILDQLLKNCILLDKNHVRSIFLLAELRYNEGYLEDSLFLISLISKHFDNSYMKSLMKSLMNETGGDPIEPKDLKEYLFTDYYYENEGKY